MHIYPFFDVFLATLNNNIFIIVGRASGYTLSHVACMLINKSRMKRMVGNGDGVKVEPVFSYALPLLFAPTIG